MAGKVLRYDWVNGEQKQEVPLKGDLIRFVPEENYLSLVSREGYDGTAVASRVNFKSHKVVEAQLPPLSRAVQASRRASQLKTANIKLGEGIYASDYSRTELFDAGVNFLRFDVDLLASEHKRVDTIKEKKAGPSALETVSGATSKAAMNEVLNDMARDSTGGYAMMDHSRYKVTLARLDAEGIPVWTGASITVLATGIYTVMGGLKAVIAYPVETVVAIEIVVP